MLNAAGHQSVEHIFSPTSIFSHDLLNPDDLPFNMQMCGSSLGNPQPIESSALYLRMADITAVCGPVKTVETYVKDLKCLQFASIKQGFGDRRTKPLKLDAEFAA